MRKSYVALLLLFGAVAFTAGLAYAQEENGQLVGAKLMNAHLSQELLSRAAKLGVSSTPEPNDTVCVGFSTAFAGSNYWSIGKGTPRGQVNTNGMWTWDTPVHGDSLQGWWPIRMLHTNSTGAVRTDVNRPWWAIEHGNQANYVINQGAGFKRTFGVVGVWHTDPGAAGGGMVPWSPCSGLKAAWMGLRAQGDLAAGLDPITGNTWNADLVRFNNTNGASASGSIGCSKNFPGYGSQMDQILYKDIDVSAWPVNKGIIVCWRWMAEMSTGKNTVANTRTGWFEGDPLTTSAGNLISAEAGTPANAEAPIDSLQMYVGAPAETTIAGVDNFEASDGVLRPIYDPLRRWFNEVLWRAKRCWWWSFSGFSPHGVWQTQYCFIPYSKLIYLSRNGKIRLAYRVHTNRGFDDEGTAYTSAGYGAAQLDDIRMGPSDAGDPADAVNLIGDFEDVDPLLSIDNTNAWAWHSTGKPPAIYFHAHDLASLPYADLCGPPGNIRRICDMVGIVISAGDHDNLEAAGGAPGTTENNGNWGMNSPTINLVAASKVPNNMGITKEQATASKDYMIAYDIYTGIFDLFATGNGWQFGVASWPAKQRNGKLSWGEIRLPGFLYFNPDVQCFKNLDQFKANGLIVTSNISTVPDSLRLHLHKLQQCYRFGVTTGCSPTDGCYFDDVALYIIDGKPEKVSVDIWQWINDTFPCNENPGLPGTLAFDTTTAVIRTGLNIAQATGTNFRYDVPGDSIAIVAAGDSLEIDMIYRVLPGPGNYITIGNRASGLRTVPTSTAGPVTPGDGTWFGTNMADPGQWASAGAVAQHAAAPSGWSEYVWNSACLDTAEANLFPIASRGINSVVDPTIWMSTYIELDSKYAALGVSHPKCFLIDTAGVATEPNIVCSGVAPGWITTVPQSRTGYDGNASTKEGTSVFPDGIFTPGTHVEYAIRRIDRKDPSGLGLTLVPDTTVVSPQPLESSFDGHRWQEFSVLPNRWKEPNYGGAGIACMLYVDWNDRRDNERIWVGIADSIGATSVADAGNHNGWARALAGADINDPAYRRYRNKGAGTTWDMYGVKASESLTTSAGQLGCRLAYRDPAISNKVHNKYSWEGPTVTMCWAYYKLLLILTGDLNSGILGPFKDRSQNDVGFLEQYMLCGTYTDMRGVWIEGDGFAESEADGDSQAGNHNSMLNLFFGMDLRATNYKGLSGNVSAQWADLVYFGATYGIGDIYGVRNACTYTLDVLLLTGDLPEAAAAADYQPYGLGFPYHASIWKNCTIARPWISLIDGFNVFNLSGRYDVTSYGRLAYYYNSFCNCFGLLCRVTGQPLVTLDTPNVGSGGEFVNFLNLRNNPLRAGSATVHFGLARQDRVEIKVYDVTGRQVRALADRQFAAGPHDVIWDGSDDNGHGVPRGVYFTQVRYLNTRFTESRKLTVLK